MKWWASHTNIIFPGGHSLCVPSFLQVLSEAPGICFAEGLMSIRVVGIQSEMYTGFTATVQHSGISGLGFFKLGSRIGGNPCIYILCPQIVSLEWIWEL